MESDAAQVLAPNRREAGGPYERPNLPSAEGDVPEGSPPLA